MTISYTEWSGPMIFKCHRCGALKHDNYDGPLPQCETCHDGATNRYLSMYPVSMHAMKVWMRCASRRAGTYERLYHKAFERLYPSALSADGANGDRPGGSLQ